MIWIAPTEKDSAAASLEKRLWDSAAPSLRFIYKLHLQIQNLRRTQDLLLPRLLSGQVNLEEH